MLLRLISSTIISNDSFPLKNIYGMWLAKTSMKLTLIIYDETSLKESIFCKTDDYSPLPKQYRARIPVVIYKKVAIIIPIPEAYVIYLFSNESYIGNKFC